MNFSRRLAQFLCTTAIALIGFYAVSAVCIAFFILTGSLTPGETMFSDSRTPTLASSLVFACVAFALVACLGFVRSKIQHSDKAAA